jgi:hypothetical protein
LRQYWELFKDTRWPGHRVAAPVKGVDSILEYDLASDFDMDDPDALTTRIETGTLAFIDRVDKFLSATQPVEQRKRSAPPGAGSSKRSRR